ncbi:peptidylprolyl isomerase [Sphingomonas xanthus]|uniref:peptidylprolyl isomerase n=2 Tax=Sphingomonas xanthus TaxID=2594473 RepID=A0A516IUH4_9SPHN|nr:peptidylprolyl isomerase [Sphingomonas xanthus]QDP20558.1 peptidylprolyl isomerase [Sphingomonas xanthus]
MIRIALPLLMALAAPLAAQSASPTIAEPAKDDLVKVALDTSAGRIVLALDRGRAPLTTANFLAYVDGGKFDGESFYRAMRYGDGGIVQGGIRSDARKLAAPIGHESTATTGLKHLRGTISMASLGPGTAKSDFFILTTDIPGFDATAAEPGFAAFGRVVEGMEIVEKILAAPVSPTKGEGSMKGQMLEPVITISKATRLKP